MSTRKMVRIRVVAALFAVLLVTPGGSAGAQRPTDEAIKCVSKAAGDLEACTAALSWKYEAACWVRFAVDVLGCGPTAILKQV